MKKSSLIGHTIELLDLIRPLAQPADNVVRDFFRTRHYLGSKDRRFISEATYGVLRHYRLLRFHGGVAAEKMGMQSALVPSLLLYAAYALKILNEPPEDVMTDVGGMWQPAFPRIPCADVLNTLAASEVPGEVLRDPAARMALMYSFPDFIVAEWLARFGEAETRDLCNALNQPAPTTIRVNTLRASPGQCRQRLLEEGVETDPGTLSPTCLILKKRVNTNSLQSYRDGWFEMQDEASQMISLLADPQPGQVVVDACAGGGGKMLHLAALMGNSGELSAIDSDEVRLSNVLPRILRAGVGNATFLHTGKDRTEIEKLRGKADAVLVDAPCSGVGTFRRNPAAKLMVDEKYADRMAALQRSILRDYAALVKPGGRLVYSTCTLIKRENEDIVNDFLAGNPAFVQVPAADILRRRDINLNFAGDHLVLLPHKTGTDGFFAAAFQRSS